MEKVTSNNGSRKLKLELRKTEIDEILGKTPGSITKWGMTIIFLTLISFFAISWFLKYPDLLNAKVTISTSPPPQVIYSRSAGTLTLLKKENEFVKQGDVIAYVNSNSSIDAVLLVENELMKGNDLSSLRLPGSLGDLHQYFGNLLSSLSSSKAFEQNKIFDIQINILKKQLATSHKLADSYNSQFRMIQQELLLAKDKFTGDSILFSQKVESTFDFIAAKTNWLQYQRNAKSIETFILNNETQINQLEKQITDLQIQKLEQTQKLELSVTQSRDQLLAQILKWKETFLFIAKTSGRLAFLGFIENQLFTESNKPLFSIVPNNGDILAKAELPILGSGKVKEGQRVNIKLDNYPFQQYGMVLGEVSSISLMPGEDKYWVIIKLPEQLRTNQHKSLEFKQQLKGTTEIITEELRLSDRFLYQFRQLIHRGG